VKSAGTNAGLNGVEDKLELYCADGSDDALLPPVGLSLYTLNAVDPYLQRIWIQLDSSLLPMK
jgi:hypothetical protein